MSTAIEGPTCARCLFAPEPDCLLCARCTDEMIAATVTPDIKAARIREQSRSLIASMIVALQEHRREIDEELAHYRSLLRNDLVEQKWSDGTVAVSFTPGFYKAIPVARAGNGLVFTRRRTDAYMRVKPVSK